MLATAVIVVGSALFGCQQQGVGATGAECTSFTAPRPLSQLPTGVLRIASLTVGSSSLIEAATLLGEVKRLPRRETEPETICYVWNGLHLYIEAGAAGGWKIVTGYELRNTKRQSNDQCLTTRSDLSSAWASTLFQTPATRRHLVTHMGKATCERSNSLRYRYVHRQVDKSPDGRPAETDMVAVIQFGFLRGALESIAVHYTETT